MRCVLIPLCLWADCYLFPGCLFLPVPLGKILIIFQVLGQLQLSQERLFLLLTSIAFSLCALIAQRIVLLWVVYMFSQMPKMMSYLRVGIMSTVCFSTGFVSKRNQKCFCLIWFKRPGWDLLGAQLRFRVNLGEFSDEMLEKISASCPQSLSLFVVPSSPHCHLFWSWNPGCPLPTRPLGDQCFLSGESGRNICFVPFSFHRILEGMRGILLRH